MDYRAPTGTADLLSETAGKWHTMQAKAAHIFGHYGYLPIETPVFEQLDVFVRGIGEATDVVGKEMFLVFSQQAVDALRQGEELSGSDVLALRPEGTAGVTRAVVQHSLVPQGSSALKVFYAGSMFRYERPQKGRLREFHQIGAECIGAAEPSADAEVIEMLMRFYAELGIPTETMQLKLNSMGDEHCRPAYREQIRQFILDHPDLCPDCRRRAESNPLRAFDCKNESCQQIMDSAAKITEALCEPCATHYQTVKTLLASSGIEFIEDHRLVRGLDYYTRTVFEVQALTGLGSQNAIGGGGRYDRLIEEYGGRATPGLGFALGFERVALVLEQLGVELYQQPEPLVYVAAVDASCRDAAYAVASQLRAAGIATELDHQARSLKSQFKAADKNNAVWAVIIGPDEIANQSATLRLMVSGFERQVKLLELPKAIMSVVTSNTHDDVQAPYAD
ncbi:MAG: histidine--tRNA ligase [Coriobacteriia bacterium]|nr:histidine--tRNA ligase [Coriobacteriia bacterium]